MKKKLLSFLVAICLVIPCLCLVGCNDTKSSKVMQLKVNPEIEFVLDKDNKVVSVNALNEDCYAILTATWAEDEDATTISAKLVGMQADEAAELFIKVCDQEQFIQVNATTNVEISISGDRVNNLYNEVKSAIENVEFEAKNIVLECEKLAKITKDELVATAKECYKELSDEYLNGLTEEELIAKIKESREETKDFVNTQMKEFYYQMRDQYVLLAKLEAIDVVGAFKTLTENLSNHINGMIGKFKEQYLSTDSAFYKNMQAYIQSKKEWLAQNVGEATSETLDELTSAVEAAQTAVDNAFSAAQTAINGLIENFSDTLSSIETAINSAISSMPNFTASFEAKFEDKMKELDAKFTDDSEDGLAQYNVSYWSQTA